MPDDCEDWVLVPSVTVGFILLLHEGVGIGWSLVFAPVLALPIALLLMLGYLLLVPVIFLIVFVLQGLAAMRAMLRRPSP